MRLISCVSGGLAAAMLAAAAPVAAAEKSIEVMHLWTSGGEAAALKVLKDAVEKAGIKWNDSAVAGAGGQTELQALQARFASGNPPAAGTEPGQVVLEYNKAGALGDLSAVGNAENWDKLMAPALLPFAKQDGKWVAVPFNMHRENTVYFNKAILDANGGKVPESWDDLLAYLEKVKQSGKAVPLAVGGDDWQEAEIVSDIMIGQGGVDFYKKAIIAGDQAALGSDTMVASLDTLRKLLSYTDASRSGRDWAIATGMVTRGEAAVQFQGDWAVGDFVKAGKKPGADFVCTSAPGNGSTFVFVTDFLTSFKQPNDGARANQEVLAKLVMDHDVQEGFNINKGSIPARLDVAPDKFNDCSKRAFKDRDASIAANTLLPSFIESVAVKQDVRGAILDAIHAFANTPSMSSKDTVAKMVAAVKAL